MKTRFALLALLIAASASAAIPTAQRQALVELHTSTGGASWTERPGWLGAAGTECQWYGVRCDGQETTVVGLELYGNGLSGFIPPSIANLPDLQFLNLSDNQIAGSIPTDLGRLAKLEQLYIQRNRLTGEIPRSLGSLANLKILSLDGNELTGRIPAELGQLRNVEELTLSYNQLSGEIPRELGQLTNLTTLELSVNELSGAIPRELASLAKLETFSALANRLSGTIPPELGALTSLTVLRLSTNQLTGTIPNELRSLRNLQQLDLAGNQLSGPIPAALGDLAALQILVLTTNQLTGPIPAELFRLANLEELYLGENQLTGTLSGEIRALTKLRVLSLWGNQLTGGIPLEVTSLAALESLELQENAFTGAIPPELSRLTNLVWLDLATNQLSGTIPTSLASLAKLEVLSLFENHLTGTIPPELGNFANLRMLFLSVNELTGPIPDSLRNLRNLQQLALNDNRLTGTIPTWLGELTRLETLFLSTNQLSGTLPASLGNLSELQYLDVAENRLTGTIPSELGNLKNLRYIALGNNEIGGAIPASFWTLTNLVDIYFHELDLTGPLPREIANLTQLETLLIQNNDFEGPLPAELGSLQNLIVLTLYGNRFTGAIPRELGNLKNLRFLDLSFNAFRGPVPAELRNLTSLDDAGSDFGYNAIFAADAATREFLNRKQYSNDFERTQTLTPTNVRVTSTTDRSAVVEWNLIPYVEDDGGYQVVASTSAGGPPVVIATTETKDQSAIVVRGLSPSTTYFFTVAAVTHPHSFQQNLLASAPTAAVAAQTGPRVVAPAEVVVTEAPKGLVQVDGVPTTEDRLVVTNFGDVSTTVTLEKEGSFFTISPESFTLAGGASQTIIIRSVPQQPFGTYYGYIAANGEGVGDDVIVYPSLLSVARPTGTVIATPVSTRVETAGAPGSDSIGSARFRNTGTATLTGIVLSDQPWIEPAREPITIAPGEIGTVNFRIIRSRRPVDTEGALSANLSLVYVDGATANALGMGIRDINANTTGVAVSTVTVVDVAKPATGSGSIPGTSGAEVALFAPGIASFVRNGASFVSDVSILNASAPRAINDLRLYFTAVGGTATSVATMRPLGSTQAVSLVNVVTNVYGAESRVGTLQVRSLDWQGLAVHAKFLAQKANGTYSSDVPVFRSDRALPADQQLYLAGVRKGSGVHTDVYLQETSGAPANVRVRFVDANGYTVGAERDETLSPYGMSELANAVPAGATTVIVSNRNGSQGRVVGYARVTDETSSDTWSIVDWGRFHRFTYADDVRVPFVDGRTSTSTGGGRRRIAVHADEPRATTELTLYNPHVDDARATLELFDANGRSTTRTIDVARGRTVTLSDIGNGASSATAHAVVHTTRGQLAVTARSYRSAAGTYGTAVPVLPALAGLRVGQQQRFSNLDDSTAATIAAATPGTYRSLVGFVETSGAPATVRASITLDEGRSLVTATVFRDFSLAANQQLVVGDLVRAIVGEQRETRFGNLHNLQLRVEVIAGSGSIVPFVIVTDNGSGDSLLRVE